MTRFTDGPAAASRTGLSLRFHPPLLRVCTSRGGLDALDAPTDMPRAGETMHAYRLERIEKLGALVCVRGKGGSSSFSSIHHYRLNDIQPTQAEMLSSMDWQAWCRAQSAIVLVDPSKGGRRVSFFQPGERVLVAGCYTLREGEVTGTLVANDTERDALKIPWPTCPVEVGIGFNPPPGQPHVLVMSRGANDCASLPPVSVAEWWRNVFRMTDRKLAEERHGRQKADHESPWDQFDTTYEVFP